MLFFSSILAWTSFLAFIPLNPAWIFVAACSTSGSFKSISISSSLFSSILGVSSCGSFSSFIALTCFLAFIPLKPACIFVAAFSTSGSSRSISTTSSSFLELSEAESSFPFSSLIFATSFLACIPLNPACILVAASSTSGSFRSISICSASSDFSSFAAASIISQGFNSSIVSSGVLSKSPSPIFFSDVPISVFSSLTMEPSLALASLILCTSFLALSPLKPA